MDKQTIADTYLEQVRRDVQSAITNLSTIVIDSVDGTDDYLDTYKVTLRLILFDLLKMRSGLR